MKIETIPLDSQGKTQENVEVFESVHSITLWLRDKTSKEYKVDDGWNWKISSSKRYVIVFRKDTVLIYPFEFIKFMKVKMKEYGEKSEQQEKPPEEKQKPQQQEQPPTEKQIQYALDLAKQKKFPIDEQKLKKMSKREISNLIEQLKG